MGLPNANFFPNSIGVNTVALATPGEETKQIFEPREMVFRALAAYSAIKAVRDPEQPQTPTKWLVWIKPAVFDTQADVINSANIRIWNGAAWVDLTPAIFARAIIELGWGCELPADAAGYLHNDGAGHFTWEAIVGGGGGGSAALTVNTIANATGNITLDGSYDVTDLTLVGNVTVNALANFTANRPHFVRFRQDGTGGRTIGINTGVVHPGAVVVAASAGAGQIDIMGVIGRTNAIAEVCLFNKGV